MRVKIQYSVELEEVPSQVDRLLPEGWEFDEVGRQLEDIDSAVSPVATMDVIESIRKDLVALDARLNDCYSILQGYIAVMANPPSEAPPGPPPPGLEEQLKALEGLTGLAAFEDATHPPGGNDDSAS